MIYAELTIGSQRIWRRLWVYTYLAEIVAGPWLVNTGRLVGPATDAHLRGAPSSLGASLDPATETHLWSRRRATGEVGADPAPPMDRKGRSAAKLEIRS